MRGLFPERDLLRALAVKVFGDPKPAPTSASPDRAGPTLGTLGNCWCGRPQDHDFPGKTEGAPHPRYPE